MIQIRDQVHDDESLRAELAAADVVLVSVGFNNAMTDPPYAAALVERYGGDWGCLGDIGTTIATYVTWALEHLDDPCVQAGLDAYAAVYDDIFSSINEVRGGAPGVLAALNVYDANLMGRDFTESGLDRPILDATWPWMISLYDRWNDMECARATEHDFTCVDLYDAFNGPGGDRPIGALSIDGAHPSQEGNDLIADLLADIDTTAIKP